MVRDEAARAGVRLDGLIPNSPFDGDYAWTRPKLFAMLREFRH